MGEWGPPDSSGAQFSHECLIPKPQPMKMEEVTISFITNPEESTSKQGQLKCVAIFATVATLTAMLYQVGLGSCIALRKSSAKYFCARDSDHFSVGDHPIELLALL